MLAVLRFVSISAKKFESRLRKSRACVPLKVIKYKYPFRGLFIKNNLDNKIRDDNKYILIDRGVNSFMFRSKPVGAVHCKTGSYPGQIEGSAPAFTNKTKVLF
jgi:hypothetical protein